MRKMLIVAVHLLKTEEEYDPGKVAVAGAGWSRAGSARTCHGSPSPNARYAQHLSARAQVPWGHVVLMQALASLDILDLCWGLDKFYGFF